MQKYDLFLILSGNLSEAEIPTQIEEIKNTLVVSGAEDVVAANLGRQKLAHQISALKVGNFVNFVFSLEQEKVKELKNKFNLDLMIARFMLTLRKKNAPAVNPAMIAPIFISREKVRERGKERYRETRREPMRNKEEKKVEKKEVDLIDINKKIDEILQHDNFVI